MAKEMTDDSELMSVFSVESEEEEDSDEDYYPWSLSGKTLQEVESPYDKHTRILQANRELFSQPIVRKKNQNKVKFDLVPKVVEMNELGEVRETEVEPQDPQSAKKETYKRRQTPMVPTPPLPITPSTTHSHHHQPAKTTSREKHERQQK